ncbi:Lipase 2 [Streptomyces sp. RB5]|uniref:Lipase 2 n=1 Tax=Streptomyces smaragdinus TaxID=2585196 RepID=A0A7K0CMV0_9ACTN|nr:SGNH/GDSL hydrolase family protein [Streptomyces smaragdinus]MQY14810.1 Lipase 2 [Streptomyces smaragdinus]
MARFRARFALLGSAVALLAGALVPAQVAASQPASAAPSADYDWVALGDSYTAGVIPASGDVFEFPRDGCDRTDRAYPQVIARDLGPLLDLTNVSCGGANIGDVTYRAQEPIGRHLPPLSEDPDYPFPAVPPQSSVVSEDTDVITVGVGGNDLHFADILFRCLQLGAESGGEGTPCKDASAREVRYRLVEASQAYGFMLTVLHDRAPHAKILAVGYPAIVPDDTSKCRYGDLEQFGTVTPGDLDWLRDEVLKPLNTLVEESAAGSDATSFVDLYDSSRAHSVCDDDRWVDGIFTDLPSTPAFVHPNAAGHRNAADAVGAAMLLNL